MGNYSVIKDVGETLKGLIESILWEDIRNKKGEVISFEVSRIKFEARNPKFETNSNDQNFASQDSRFARIQMFKTMMGESFEFCALNFDIVSDFDIRISDFKNGEWRKFGGK